MISILIVDDSEAILNLLRQRLQQYEYKILTVNTGEKALELLHEETVDLILLDQMMPDMDGIGTFKRIKKEIHNHPPVMMSTAHSSIHLAVEFMKIGGVDFIPKPIDHDILNIKILRAVENTRRLRKEIHARKRLVNKLRKAKATAEAADRLKSQFLANVSHDIRTPLNCIVGFTDLLSPIQQGQGEEYVNIIRNHSNILLTLIGDILDFSKIEANQLEIERIPYSLQEIFDNVYSATKFLLSQKSEPIALKKNIPDELNYVVCDPIRIQQILNNLLSNAVKFTESGEIEFGVERKGEQTLQFYVKDTGTGIPQDKREQIFIPFQQADSSISRKYGGTGLGLPIVKRLLELMGGKMTFETEVGDNHHTVFYFTLPLEPVTDYKTKKITKADFDVILRGGKKILLVDDHLDNQLLAQLILEKLGFEVVIANDGQEAVDLFREHFDFDLILMDLHMPNLDGIQATLQIRNLESEKGNGSTIPILAATAEALKSEHDKLMDAGCNDYIIKPFNRYRLANLLAKHLS